MTDSGPVVPAELTDAVSVADQEMRAHKPDRRSDRGLLFYLQKWRRLAEDAADYRGFGDDYLHSLGSRIRLREWMQLCEGDLLWWLLNEVDEIDEIFRRNTHHTSSYNFLIQASNPDDWWFRRDPNDPELLQHLRIIRGEQADTRPRPQG